MSKALTLISSMATRHLLNDLVAAHARAGGLTARIESTGGVEAAKRVQQGEPFDLVVLASEAIVKLEEDGCLRPGSIRPLVDSSVAIAVRAGADQPDVSTEMALQRAIVQARTIGYSTGPSGTALLKIISRWGRLDSLKSRLVQARPGVPVGSLVASGEVEIGFQQLSELKGMPDIVLLGGLPPGLAIVTRFSGAVISSSTQPEAAQSLLDFMTSPSTTELKKEHGMEAVPIWH